MNCTSGEHAGGYHALQKSPTSNRNGLNCSVTVDFGPTWNARTCAPVRMASAAGARSAAVGRFDRPGTLRTLGRDNCCRDRIVALSSALTCWPSWGASKAASRLSPVMSRPCVHHDRKLQLDSSCVGF